ncbi:hypothetical protein, partial [Klebsiella pneumoniae]|uniref:hypothetical protein n=1 Tax=Klebsiella pneumoniae TaxID=573 RepID=UPI0013D6AED4
SKIMRTAIETAQLTTEATSAFPHLKSSIVTYTLDDGLMKYVVVKDYHETMNIARRRFSGYKDGEFDMGNTPTGRAMIY